VCGVKCVYIKQEEWAQDSWDGITETTSKVESISRNKEKGTTIKDKIWRLLRVEMESYINRLRAKHAAGWDTTLTNVRK